jgi:PAS domain S-box-containing protein
MSAAPSSMARIAPDRGMFEEVLRTVRCVAWRVRLADFATVYVSDNSEEVLGYPADAWPTQAAWLERVHPADRDRITDQIRAALISGQSFEREYRILHPDGRTVWIHDTIGIVHDAAGTAVELQGMTVDVTERRNREDALRFDRDRLQIAIDVAGVSAWEWHADSDRVVADPIGRALLPERPWQNASASDFLEHVHPDDRGRLYGMAMRALTTGEPFVMTFRAPLPDGNVRWIETYVRPKGGPGKWNTLVGASRDVTEHMEALNDARLRSILFDSLGEGVSVSRADGTITYVNAALERMFGYAPDELIGQNMRVMTARSEFDYARRLTALLGTVEREGTWTGTLRCRSKNGAVLHTMSTVTRVVVGGEPLWITVQRDVTERQQLQREVLAASQREKEALAHALHDGLAQQLTGIALLAGTLRDDGERRASPVAGSLRRLADLLQEAVGTCRRLAQGVSGFVVKHGGLQIGLRELALAYERRVDVPCEVDVDQATSDAVDPERARHLYWMAEDALKVAVELGRPGPAHLQLDRVDHHVRLRVSLSGLPLEELTEREPPALNLIGYRAGLLGAGLATMPSPDGGVTIEILCPPEDGTGVKP